MQVVIHLGDKPVSLNLRDFDEEIDIDEMLTIDYSNLYGEAVTIASLFNHVGILKAEAERNVATKKAELDVYKAELKQRFRREATETAQKVTESGLDEMVEVDPGYKIKKKNFITANYQLGVVDSIYWSVSTKNKKLDNLITGVTPQELYKELVEGTINNIVLKKHKSITER
jgi:hypothetical protein